MAVLSGQLCASYEAKNAVAQTQRAFVVETEKVEKALCRLSESIGNMTAQLSPVLRPESPVGEVICKDQPTPPLSQFEEFISSLCNRLYGHASGIDRVSERSSV